MDSYRFRDEIMVDNPETEKNQLDDQVPAIKKALKYAEDLAIIYQEEKTRNRALKAVNEKIWAIMDSMSGGMLARKWNLSERICNVLDYHHYPSFFAVN